MISYDEIRQLQEYPSANDSCVLSLYVSVDQTKAANLNRGFETAAENALRRINTAESGNGNGPIARFETERQRALRALRDYTPRGKCLVLFSDSSRSFWWQKELQVDMPTEARWSPLPWVRPLLALIEQHDPVGVVLIDKHRARILIADATGIEQHAEIISDVPGKHQTTGTDHIWSQSQMERDHVKHIKWHAKRVAEGLTAAVDRFKPARLVVGGPVEATSMFTDELPKRLQQLMIGTLSVPVDISADRLLDELKAIQEQAEHADELKLVESLITAARKRDRAVLGLAQTLDAAEQGRIYRLVVDGNFRSDGAQCASCHVLFEEKSDKCSFCGGQVNVAPDLINRLSHRVLEQGGKVCTVSGAAANLLGTAGRIGAVLRF